MVMWGRFCTRFRGVEGFLAVPKSLDFREFRYRRPSRSDFAATVTRGFLLRGVSTTTRKRATGFAGVPSASHADQIGAP